MVHPDDIRVRDGDFEVTATFESLYSGTCTIDSSHQIKKRDRIGRIRSISNPVLPIPGYACAHCLRVLPRATREDSA